MTLPLGDVTGSPHPSSLNSGPPQPRTAHPLPKGAGPAVGGTLPALALDWLNSRQRCFTIGPLVLFALPSPGFPLPARTYASAVTMIGDILLFG